MGEEDTTGPRAAPKIIGAQGQEHGVGLRAGGMLKKTWHLRVYTAPHATNDVRQRPSSLNLALLLTRPLPSTQLRVITESRLPIHHLGPHLLRSRNCTRLVEPEPTWRRPYNQGRTAKATAAVGRVPWGSEASMLRAAWRALSSIRTQAVTQAPVLGLPGGGCAKLLSVQRDLPSRPGGEELRSRTAEVGKWGSAEIEDTREEVRGEGGGV